MRLKRLDLLRYGKFTDRRLDFGDRQPGRSDFHLVYGPNEAGKTTVLNAFLDLLFGIEVKSRFNFLHGYATMRVGACLEQAGDVHELIRIKRQHNTLLDGRDEQVIAEAAIGGGLGGIDRDSYRAMFSLDDETIERGGESILASKGDLGQLLFSASAGLADLSQTLARLRAEAEAFYRPNARQNELAALKAAVAQHREARERIDTLAPVHRQLTEQCRRALDSHGTALADRSAIHDRRRVIEAQLRALPRLRELLELRVALQPLLSLPEAPGGWAGEVPGLMKDEVEISVKLSRTLADIEAGRAALDALPQDAAALELAERVEAWQVLHDRAKLAALDIPARAQEVAAQDAEIARILDRIGQAASAAPRAFVLPPATVERLRKLIEQHSGLAESTRRAQQELDQAQRRLQAALDALREVARGEHAGGPAALAPLEAALHGEDTHADRLLAEKQRELAAALDELSELMRDLLPWHGSGDDLADIRAPGAADLHAWKTAVDTAEQTQARHDAALTQLRGKHRQLQAQRTAIADGAGVVSDGDAAALRAAREAAWANHRRLLDSDSADAFEDVLRRDDIVTAARLRHEREIARLQDLDERLAVSSAELQREQEMLAQAGIGLQAARAAVAAAVAGVSPSLPQAMTIAQLEALLHKRDKALDARARLRRTETALTLAQRDVGQARQRLVQALTLGGVPHDAAMDTAALVAIAQAALKHDDAWRKLREDVQKCRRDVAAREADAAQAARDEATWLAAWSEVCSGCWLRALGAVPALAAVRDVLASGATLGPALDKRDELLARITAMQQDQRVFAAEVAGVARALGMAEQDGPALDLARDIIARVHAARRDSDRRNGRLAELDKALAEARELADAEARLARRRAVMTAFFGVDSLDVVADKLRQLERRAEKQAQAARLEQQIIDALHVTAVAEAEALLANADPVALDTELRDLTTRFDAADQRVQELHTEYRRAQERIDAIDGDDAVARLEQQRRTDLLRIEDGAVRHLKRRLGIAAAEQALRLYRHRHQSSMMERASQAFRTMTRDAYRGLASEPDRDREILVAIAADGSSREAEKLSKGTRFQLYLALRVAGYHEFARQRQPVPFIADDIMETFDDFRAEEAMRLFAEMGQVGQVIYLTHHRHLCEIATKVCPGVRVHELT